MGTIYFDQRPQVHLNTGEQQPIRICFSDVTLALDEVNASWLAANIQRELRELDRRKGEATRGEK